MLQKFNKTVSCPKLALRWHELCIWRNGVLFTNLHSGHLGISMVDSNTTEYIEKKIIFKLSSHWQFGNISSSSVMKVLNANSLILKIDLD